MSIASLLVHLNTHDSANAPHLMIIREFLHSAFSAAKLHRPHPYATQLPQSLIRIRVASTSELAFQATNPTRNPRKVTNVVTAPHCNLLYQLLSPPHSASHSALTFYELSSFQSTLLHSENL
jgi:hypothetical protein